ncbi:hypothetical protein [Microbacterium sediminis]|uniref:Uncharacterized protein n=1 Tax=Microbacterium sediminis TaxID=904291 RepID=A0A1B9NA76_9MICO|nr:hypothetical protein [Microbacterium sediminis]OCG73480.1 hypothetical protein A7J15_07260 [Microbacterium sediminis]
MTRFRRALAPLAFVGVLALAACSPLLPQRGAASAVPGAIEEDVTGVVEADAGTSMSGFNYHLNVWVVLDRAEITADELRSILAAAVDHATGDYSYLYVYADSLIEGVEAPLDASAALTTLAPDIDEDATDGDISLPWTDVLEILENS